MNEQLSQEEIELIKKAREAQSIQKSLGAIHLGKPNPQEPLQEPPESIPQPPPTQPNADIKINEGKPEADRQFDTFVELTNIPSKGRFYKDVVKAQPMKVPDLILIQGINDDNMTSRFTDIFGRRIRGVAPLDILLIDEYYFSLWLRHATFPTYLFPHDEYSCIKCGFKVPSKMAEFSFNQIEIKTNLDTIIAEFGDKDYIEKQLPISKQIIKIHPKRRLHLARAEKILEENYKSKDITPPEGIADLLYLISNIEIGPVADLRKIFAYVQSEDIDPIDYIELLKMCVKYITTDEAVVNFKCPNPDCKEVTPVKGYPFQSGIYLPLDEHREHETGEM